MPNVIKTATPLIDAAAAPAPSVAAPPAPGARACTFLPHWGWIRRAIHSKCARSRLFNTIVSSIEMRLAREELLSLPQYMSLCPTGQCNAMCAFCSVTTNRTGITKKQLAFDKLDRFLSPVANTIRMYGLEGNGEPTLYDQFDELVEVLTSRGACFYLITNGEQLTFDQVDMMLNHNVDSINFSLNAATAETHRRVMKLKHFDRVKANIQRLATQRKAPFNPILSVSIVVTGENIHEIQECLRFGEYELGVDRVLVRPLSEIANDEGAVEDARDLVPFESDVKDMLEGVRDYLEDVPRKCEIYIKPDDFKNVRPDPIDRVLTPLGYENRLLAPRRRHWDKVNSSLQLSWHLNTATLNCPADSRPGVLCYGHPMPVEPGKTLAFQCKMKVNGSPLTLAITALDGQRIAAIDVAPGAGMQEISFPIDTGIHNWVRTSLIYGGGPLHAEIDFERLRSPGAGLKTEIKLPPPRRWQIDSPGTIVEWKDSTVRVKWSGKPGLYLVKSYTVQCLPATTLSIPIDVNVHSGALTIGILNEDFKKWVHKFSFETGSQSTTLDIQTGTNHRVQIVLFSKNEEALDAEINWRDILEGVHQRSQETGLSEVLHDNRQSRMGDPSPAIQTPAVAPEGTPPAPEAPAKTLEPAAQTVPIVAPKLVNSSSSIRNLWRRIRYGKVKYYCQKPFTDMHNFTVDGRMDVCCIATGASQPYYALGNIMNQEFQEVWNSERAKEFRRTVNSGKPLPPCQRCPMAFQYQGPFFHPENTREMLRVKLSQRLGENAVIRPFIRAAVWIFDLIFFHGFKRTL